MWKSTRRKSLVCELMPETLAPTRREANAVAGPMRDDATIDLVDATQVPIATNHGDTSGAGLCLGKLSKLTEACEIVSHRPVFGHLSLQKSQHMHGLKRYLPSRWRERCPGLWQDLCTWNALVDHHSFITQCDVQATKVPKISAKSWSSRGATTTVASARSARPEHTSSGDKRWNGECSSIWLHLRRINHRSIAIVPVQPPPGRA